MEDQIGFGDETLANLVREVKLEEDEEEFRSCCEDEEDWKESNDSVKESSQSQDNPDEFSARILFKGMSIADAGESGLSGIGVVIERSENVLLIQVQKKLEFYVEESVADYLALMDGLMEAMRNKIRRVFAFTDSDILYNQITCEKELDNPLLIALKERILEQAHNLETFSLKLVPNSYLDKPSKLAQVAIGIVSLPAKGDLSLESCSICCEEKPSPMMIKMKCLHKFCSHCMKTYVNGRVQSSQVPIRCPQLRCKYYISTTECRSFLPVMCYESLEKALAEANILNSEKIYCPFPNCSALLDPHECLPTRASSSCQSDNRCIECPFCQRFICVECGVPWHSSMSCEEYQNLPLEERDAEDITLYHLAQNNQWRRCQQCRRMIELTQGCYHMICRCRHEFCYSCGAEYRDGQQTCQCTFWDEGNSRHSQESEQWEWDSFNSLSMIMDAYSDQERSQLALIQRFLAGGFSLSDHHPHQSPPPCTDSYVDAMKDLHQLPWLERFVSVISDDYYEDYI
ncbi:E3 ubiquitin-protein ligase RSL1 [Malania oleifera]|uniref:E3 ubiquitin-protein ligase RSL1 n=1 Tax=Malania oleifera TaxID=397392 RepID=UPI0025AEBEC9|nr:E3 ubiquitin-protein ligase RSL1 [Malania oleifera]XP_057970215.1 E3 ubiquitin-protein ligase RSL1 [Malania oleifera]XP_057970216.1 E3 ubiquitin-protein ligase RSL1 [Malania oleifera]